jgi:type VI protein secretion system component VasK
MSIQRGFYPAGAKQPKYSFTLQPYPSEGIEELTLEIDGQSYTAKKKHEDPMAFSWPGNGQGVTLSAKFHGGSKLTLLHYGGPWAVFQFFGAAAHMKAEGTVWRVQWSPTTSGQPMTLPNGHPVVIQFDVNTAGMPFLFERGLFSGLTCVSRIAH